MKPPNPRGGLPLERSAFENMYRPAPVFRPAGFTPPSEPDAARELRPLRCRGFSRAPPGSMEHFMSEMLRPAGQRAMRPTGRRPAGAVPVTGQNAAAGSGCVISAAARRRRQAVDT